MKILLLTRAFGACILMFAFLNCFDQTVAAPAVVSTRRMSSACINRYHTLPYAMWKHLCSQPTTGKRTNGFEKSFQEAEDSLDQIENLTKEEVAFVKYLLYDPQKLDQWLQDNADMIRQNID